MKLGGRFIPVKPSAINHSRSIPRPLFDVISLPAIGRKSTGMPLVLITAAKFYSMAVESFIPKLT